MLKPNREDLMRFTALQKVTRVETLRARLAVVKKLNAAVAPLLRYSTLKVIHCFQNRFFFSSHGGRWSLWCMNFKLHVCVRWNDHQKWLLLCVCVSDTDYVCAWLSLTQDNKKATEDCNVSMGAYILRLKNALFFNTKVAFFPLVFYLYFRLFRGGLRFLSELSVGCTKRKMSFCVLCDWTHRKPCGRQL